MEIGEHLVSSPSPYHNPFTISPLPPIGQFPTSNPLAFSSSDSLSSISSSFSQLNLHNPTSHDPTFSPISDHWVPHKDSFFTHFTSSPSPSFYLSDYESVSPYTNPTFAMNPNSILNLKPLKNRVRRSNLKENAVDSINFAKLTDLRGRICQIAREQSGSQMLQECVCKEEPNEVSFIVEEVVCCVGDLMADPFANYLMQKLFEVGSTEQLTRLVWFLTRDPRGPIIVSLNHFGTRSMQVLIEQLASRNMTSLALLLTSALKNNVVQLSTDVNGYHVINACLSWLPYNLKRFIFEKAALHCINISRDKHGCCVLQLCIKKAQGPDKERIIASVCANGFFLSQDAYGNYVVQCILGLEEAPWVCTHLAYRLRGHYARLAKHKCSSNVVEKCLEKCEAEVREGIIYELLEDNEFEQLLLHPYANYVIRTALKSSQGRVRNMLVEAIKPHMENMRTNPYSKRIYSTLLHIM